jgi:hypothetical protein
MKAGWQALSLEAVLERVSYTPKIQRKDFLKTGAFPIVSQEEGLINGYWNDANAVFRVRKPLVIFGDHTKALKYVDFDFVLGADGVKLLQPRDFLVPRFFHYQLMTLELGSLGYARYYRILKEQQIRFPSVGEQQRIVAVLDEAFERIASARAIAKRNLANASSLFGSELETVFAELYRDSAISALSDLALSITDGDHMPPPKAQSGIPFITISNVDKHSRAIDFSSTFMVPRDYYDALKPARRPTVGDVLYTVTGSFGIPVLVTEDVEFCFQRHIGLVRPKPTIDPCWLSYVLLSPQAYRQADAGATGTAQRTVSLKLLRGFRVPYVLVERQREVAAQLSAVEAETRRLASIYQRKIDALDELKKSLLHEAFSGNL